MQVHDALEMLDGAGFDRLGPTVWADLGCGIGTFTSALAGLLAPGSAIHALDRDAAALRQVPTDAPGVTIVTRVADIEADPPGIARLDGVLMANSLHYVQDQTAFIERWTRRMAAPARFVIVEYDTDTANRWLPYPISRSKLTDLFVALPGAEVRELGRRPSIYQRAPLYAALITAAH